MKQNKKNQNEDVKGSSSILFLPKMDISLFGLKLLTEYLRKVDLHNPKQLKVKFENEEIKKILEVDNVEKEFLNKKLKELFISIMPKTSHNLLTSIVENTSYESSGERFFVFTLSGCASVNSLSTARIAKFRCF